MAAGPVLVAGPAQQGEHVTTTQPYLSRQVTLTVQGQRLGGLAYVPRTASSAPAPLVICCHGMEGSHTRVAPMARRFAGAGAVAICFDFRGGGGSASQGETTAMSALTELADLEAVLTAACAWPEVDASRVALFGLSLGGAVAALAAARHPQRITALALWYPALRLGENLRAAFHTPAAVPEEFDWAGTRLGRAYAVDGWNLEVGAELATYRRPVLIVHGDQDRAVPIEVSRAAVSATPDAELVTIPGAAHGFGDANWEEAMRRTIGFLAWNGVLEEDREE
ncbi:alpha/beta fold hydrolase [Actinomyces sp. HMT 175]|nr:alpha/beta fold hydrolase [Actinomyces sp. HMT 175]